MEWRLHLHINVTAEVLEELDLALGESDARLQRHQAAQRSVEAGDDFGLVLLDVPAVLQLQQVQIQLWIRLQGENHTCKHLHICKPATGSGEIQSSLKVQFKKF